MSLIVMPKSDKKQTPKECLEDALKKIETGEIGNILILYESQDEKTAGSLDSGLTIKDCLYIIELFKHWLMKACLHE